MGWNAGVTRTTGDLITAADWNKYLGASGSLDYLKTQIEDWSFSDTLRSLDTEYHNGNSLRLVAVRLTIWEDGDIVDVKIGSSSANNTILGCGNHDVTGTLYLPITFLVPPNYYYGCFTAAGSPGRSYWAEWDIH